MYVIIISIDEQTDLLSGFDHSTWHGAWHRVSILYLFIDGKDIIIRALEDTPMSCPISKIDVFQLFPST